MSRVNIYSYARGRGFPDGSGRRTWSRSKNWYFAVAKRAFFRKPIVWENESFFELRSQPVIVQVFKTAVIGRRSEFEHEKNRNVWQSRLLGSFLDVSVTWSSSTSKILKKLMCIYTVMSQRTWTSIQTSGEKCIISLSSRSFPTQLPYVLFQGQVPCAQVPWRLSSPPHVQLRSTRA